MDIRKVKYVVFGIGISLTLTLVKLPVQAADDVSGNNWQDKVGSAWNTAKDVAGPAWQFVKDKTADAAEKVKEKAPEVKEDIQNAAEQASTEFSEYRTGQEAQFWDWFEDQTGGTVPSDQEESVVPEVIAEPEAPVAERPEETPASSEETQVVIEEEKLANEPLPGDQHDGVNFDEPLEGPAADYAVDQPEETMPDETTEEEQSQLKSWQVLVVILIVIVVAAVFYFLGQVHGAMRRASR